MDPSPISVRTRLAFAFSADLTLDKMLIRLNAEGPWAWREGDSGWYGDYIATQADPHDAVLRIYEGSHRETWQYALNLRYLSRRPTERAVADLAAVRAKVLDEVLPSIGARDVTPTEPHD